MSAQVIPLPKDGAGHYTWTASTAITNRYTIRRGARIIGHISLADNLPFHAEIVTRFCAALDEQEREVTCPGST